MNDHTTYPLYVTEEEKAVQKNLLVATIQKRHERIAEIDGALPTASEQDKIALIQERAVQVARLQKLSAEQEKQTGE